MSATMPLRELPRARAGERWRAAGWVLAVWTLVGLFRAADRYFSDPFQLQRLEFGLWEALAQNLLSSTIWAALTPLVVWLARRSVPTTSNWAAPVAQLAAGGLVFPVVHGVAYQLAYPLLMGFPCVLEVQLSALWQLLPLTFPTHFVTYSAIVGVTWALGYSRLSRERDLRASQVKTRLASARLEALKGQLHPHFLFNTLNSILPLVFRDGEAASRTVVRLADLLRLSLQNEGHDLIPFRKELELLRVYLEIQQTRFQDRLTARFDLEPGIEDALVPNLILQPLVENAIKHGIAAKPGSGRVEVHARREGPDRIRLIVRDDGPGPTATVRRTGGEGGVGLRNTRDRLELLYGERHEFEFRGAPGRGCEVSLSFPLTLEPRIESRPRPDARRQESRALGRVAALAVAGAAVLASAAEAASPTGPYARAVTQSQEMLDQVLQLYPGTAVAVAVGDSIVWSQAFGFSDVDRQRHVTRSTQFRIYEAAMPLTATVMERLAEQGRFDPDASLQKYLPDLPDTQVPVTGRALASHLAGVRDFDEDEEILAPCSGAREAVRTLRGRIFVRPAGLGHNFSRQGYLLLSAALEAATDRAFGDLLQETLAGPAGMSSTMIDDPRRFLPGRSNFYERGFLGLLRAARPVDTSCLWGAGGLVSTTEDLVRFGTALLRGELLRRESIEAMFAPQKTRNGTTTAYGLGWHVETDSRGRRYVWHSGRGVGGRAAIVIVPHVRLVTVMLSNIEGERLDEHARRIAAFFLEGAESTGGPPDLIRASGPGKPPPPFAYRAAPAPGE
jgi:CubicO group peptidase (beta-lactamase class C family)/two-component sensor histidine kinase